MHFFVAFSIWKLCLNKLIRRLEFNSASKTGLKLKEMFEGRKVQIFSKAFSIMIFLGALAGIVAVAVVFFGVRFDKQEFIHSEISMLVIVLYSAFYYEVFDSFISNC